MTDCYMTDCYMTECCVTECDMVDPGITVCEITGWLWHDIQWHDLQLRDSNSRDVTTDRDMTWQRHDMTETWHDRGMTWQCHDMTETRHDRVMTCVTGRVWLVQVWLNRLYWGVHCAGDWVQPADLTPQQDRHLQHHRGHQAQAVGRQPAPHQVGRGELHPLQ